jgi:NADH-quinone oxidoreductase subunit G
VIIDGKEIEIRKGETILEAALRSGIFIPHYCYHPALSTPANCRMCLVELEGQGKLFASCATPAMDNMVVHTQSEKVKANQKGVMEFLLLNHPLDCPVCDKAGECDLQDFSYGYGKPQTRNDIGKRVLPKKDLGGDILLYTQRCIMCTRCVRFLDEFTETSELYVENRGQKSEIAVFPGTAPDNPMAGNIVDICPVGALKSKEFLFKSRVWELRKHDGICGRCSVGCNTIVDETRGVVQRIRPRTNLDVNGYFICDFGRHGFDYVARENRLDQPQLRHGETLAAATWESALAAAKEGLEAAAREKSVACLVSPFVTNEEAFLAAELIEERLGGARTALLPKKDRAADLEFPGGFRISKDVAPNAGGVADMLQARLGKLHDAEAILSDAAAGKLRGLLVLGGNPAPQDNLVPAEALAKVGCVVVVDILCGPLTEAAHVVLPGLSPFEKDGTFTNDRERVQRFHGAVPGVGNARPEWRILSELGHVLGGPPPVSGAAEVTDRIAETVPGYEGLGWKAIGDLGRPKGSGAPEPETVGAKEEA